MSGAETAGKFVPEREDEEAEQQRLLAVIEAGLADADAGRVRSHAEVVARMRARFGRQSE